MRILVICAGAYGGGGGIAQYTRDLLEALVADDGVREVVAIPRIVDAPVEGVPSALRYCIPRSHSKSAFVWELARVLFWRRRFDLVICAHINLLPLARMACMVTRAPLWLVVYGTDAWRPHGSRLVRAGLGRVDRVVTISRLTGHRLASWSNIAWSRITVLPNAVDLARLTPGPRNERLAERVGATGSPVLMTLGRMDSRERAKGFDEVLQVLPSLVAHFPRLTYLAAGEGSDRARLEEKSRALGVADHVRFPGYIPEDQKRDWYGLCDLFLLPSRGEGFGFVLLEALACGVPVIASAIDGGREAVCDGELGALVDPDDPEALVRAVIDALARPKPTVQPGLARFSPQQFRERVRAMLSAQRACLPDGQAFRPASGRVRGGSDRRA